MASVSKKSVKQLPNGDVEIATPKKRYISPEERQHIIDELSLIPKRMPILRKHKKLLMN